MNQAKIHLIETRYAIICATKEGAEYIYKSYADKKNLNVGMENLKQNRWKPFGCRITKIKISTEEVC